MTLTDNLPASFSTALLKTSTSRLASYGINFTPLSLQSFCRILNNIILNNDKSKNFDENLLNVAIKNSELSSFVSSLEDGIYTNLGEKGNKISGGQKQRIGIARCLYKKKEVIILDEATNSLDKHTEKQILNNLKNLKKEKTIVIVSHEPSVIEYCDHIFKIENFDIDQIK